MTDHDNIYRTALESVPDFTFDKAVARVFPDMIRRSVPGYAETVAMSGIIAARYAQSDSAVYDLGCSLGAVTLAMRHAITQPDCRIVAVDNSSSMLEQASHYIALDDGKVPVELVCADICDYRMKNASVTALNFVLQFIPLEQRSALLQKIADATLPGGALILSEKIAFEADEQNLQTDLHHDFKRANGYSELEISQKRNALENVMRPDTLSCHHERFARLGFSHTQVWYQCFNFCSMIVIK